MTHYDGQAGDYEISEKNIDEQICQEKNGDSTIRKFFPCGLCTNPQEKLSLFTLFVSSVITDYVSGGAIKDKFQSAISTLGFATNVGETVRHWRETLIEIHRKKGVNFNDCFTEVVMNMISQAVSSIHAVLILFFTVLKCTMVFGQVLTFALGLFLDVITTPTKCEMVIKLVIYSLQILFMLFMCSFLVGTIFTPILSMHFTIAKSIFATIVNIE